LTLLQKYPSFVLSRSTQVIALVKEEIIPVLPLKEFDPALLESLPRTFLAAFDHGISELVSRFE